MRQIATQVALAAAFLAASVLAHGDDSADPNMEMDMDMSMNTPSPSPSLAPSASAHPNSEGPMSYFAYDKHRGAILAHISLMVVAWCFLLPTCECKHRQGEKVIVN